ncbi:MAG: hypothetical protein ACK5S6_03220, partial [bacterium]
AFTWALTYYAMKMDVVDRNMQDVIIQNKRFKGELLRDGMSEKSMFGESYQSRQRMYTADTMVNDPDYDGTVAGLDDRSPFGRGRRGGRGRLGYE